MSHATRLYRQRNAHIHDEATKAPFFGKQYDTTEAPGKGTFFQAKLSVNQPGDIYEKEADAVANAVVNQKNSSPVIQQKKISSIQRLTSGEEEEKLSTNDARVRKDKEIQAKPEVQRMCPECEKEKDIQTKSDGNGSSASHSFSARIESSAGKGKHMPVHTMADMNSSFGMNFNDVNIHTDAAAIQMNKEINAQAFTHGNDIYFNSGKYNPQTSEGKQLLAHELTHVVQQQSARKIQRTIGDGHDLNASRFTGNNTLEAVYDNERLLRRGSKGPAVRHLQQALLDAGMSLPLFGVDGDFGSETEAAVRSFQTASGLSTAGVDGIVGPTTMGWLDQLFSASATPAGTSAGATTGCAAFKNVTIDFVSLDGSTRNPVTDLNFLNSVFNQACVKFTLGTGVSVSGPDTQAMLGGDNDLSRLHSCSATSAEEDSMRSNSTGSFGLSGKIKVFYVQSMTPALNGVSFPPFCSSGTRAPFLFHTYISNLANDRTLAHEMGHQLLNCECHVQADPFNLLIPNGPGSNLDATQEGTIFSNA